ncbi:Eukaryotic translation initiation factor 3 subunit E [Nowakowskiella sp. JEL0078]|nr:Eukaryotic translation initiation factor 3 subunit E [Nowakowskiella sp. JEL0078]
MDVESVPAVSANAGSSFPITTGVGAEASGLGRVTAEYDLTSSLLEFWDPHFGLPLFEFLGFRQMYPADEILRAKHSVLSSTYMVDYVDAVYQEMNNTEEHAPESLSGYDERRSEVLEELASLEEESSAIMNIIQDPTVIQQLKQDKLANIQFLEENHGFKPEMLNALFKFSQFMYKAGRYGPSAEMLYHYRILSTDPEKNLSALWGKLASEILTNNWETAYDDLMRLKDMIDQRTNATHRQQLRLRAWLIHWSLFVFFNHAKGRDGIIDLFFQPAYINTIQTLCPWILRYLCTAVITNKRRRNVLKELTKIVQQESHTYRDPITEFVEALYVNFDFEEAQKKQRECEDVLLNDFFLVATRDEFIENARLMIFETYCRIHQVIDIAGLSEKLNMGQDDGEKWIVNLIRNAKMDAKIDAETNTVVMGTQYQSVYQQVIERTRALTFRSSLLASNIEKREAELSNRRLQADSETPGGKKARVQFADGNNME